MRRAEGGVDGGLGQRVGDGRARDCCPLLSSLMTSQPLTFLQGVSSGSASTPYCRGKYQCCPLQQPLLSDRKFSL